MDVWSERAGSLSWLMEKDREAMEEGGEYTVYNTHAGMCQDNNCRQVCAE